MMKIKINLSRILFGIISILLIGFALQISTYAAGPSLLLSPTSTNATVNQNTTLTLSIDTNTSQVFGADAIISYPETLVDIVSVTKGDFFTDFTYSASNGSLEIHGYFASLYDFKAGSGTLATIVARPKQTGSTSTLAIVCNTSSQTSQIINNLGSNILPCANTNQSVITVAAPTTTPLPTNTTAPGQPTNTPSPTTSGNRIPTCSGLGVNPSSGYKPLTVNFSCSGNDADNDITTAEFDFGNGSKIVIDRNIGQVGSISTSYTYSTVGTFTATCRLKDNNQAFSTVPDACKKTITTSTRVYTAAPSRTPTQRAGSTNAPRAPIPSPTIGFGSRIVLAPYATPTPLLLPQPETPTPKSLAKISTDAINMAIAGGVLLFIILILLLLRYLGRKSQEPLQ